MRLGVGRTQGRSAAQRGLTMLANWLLLPYVIASIWWTYSPLDDWLYFAQALRTPS